MKIFRIYLVSAAVVCALSLVGAAPTLDGLLGGDGLDKGGLLGGLLGGGEGGGLLGGLPDKSSLFGGLLGGNSRSDDDGDPFQAVGGGTIGLNLEMLLMPDGKKTLLSLAYSVPPTNQIAKTAF